MSLALKGNLVSSVRELGRTRIEVVPRGSNSVFVYWEVADTTPAESPPTEICLRIDLVREADDEVTHSFETTERCDGRIVEVSSDDRYYAVLNLDSPQQHRLARSSTTAGVRESPDGGFVTVEPTEDGLSTAPTEAEDESAIDWSWHDTDSSGR